MSASRSQRLDFLSKLDRNLKSIAFAARLPKPIPPSCLGLWAAPERERRMTDHGHFIGVTRAESIGADQAWAGCGPVGRVVRATESAAQRQNRRKDTSA